MISAVDTNIILDVLIPDEKFGAASKALLNKAYQRGALIICEMVYAQLATQFESQQELDKFLKVTGILLEPSSPRSLYRAGLSWQRYRGRRSEKIQCSNCGNKLEVECQACGYKLSKRPHILSDFLIGGHALAQADVLLTRDRGYYRTYFKQLKIESG